MHVRRQTRSPDVAIIVSGPASPNDLRLMRAIGKAAQAQLKSQAKEVEELISAGHDEVEVRYLPGFPRDVRRIVYKVPNWREHPLRRVRIAWARWRRTR